MSIFPGAPTMDPAPSLSTSFLPPTLGEEYFHCSRQEGIQGDGPENTLKDNDIKMALRRQKRWKQRRGDGEEGVYRDVRGDLYRELFPSLPSSATSGSIGFCQVLSALFLFLLGSLGWMLLCLAVHLKSVS